MYPVLVDWEADCVECEDDHANSTKWNTRMKATHLHNNAICEELARNLIHVPGDGYETWSIFYLPLTNTYANLSPVLFRIFATPPNAILKMTGMMKPTVVCLPPMVATVLSITLFILFKLSLSRKMTGRVLLRNLSSVIGTTMRLLQ